MCMVTIEDVAVLSSHRAWKAFYCWDGLLAELFSPEVLPEDEWLQANPVSSSLWGARANDSGRVPSYYTGFHSFERREDAEAYARRFYSEREYAVREVELRGIAYYGQQSPWNHDSLGWTAQEMRILPEEVGW